MDGSVQRVEKKTGARFSQFYLYLGSVGSRDPLSTNQRPGNSPRAQPGKFGERVPFWFMSLDWTGNPIPIPGSRNQNHTEVLFCYGYAPLTMISYPHHPDLPQLLYTNNPV